MNKIKKKAIRLIQEKELHIENFNDYIIFSNTIYSLSKNNLLKNAKEKINKILKNQNRDGEFEFEFFTSTPIFFLKGITKYLEKNNEKKEIKEYLKSIRKSINYIEKNFDDYYLLISSLDYIRKKEFFAKENAVFLEICDSLSELLNKFDFNEEADRIFMIKGKLELGFLRYMYNNETKKLLKKFNTKGEFEFATNIEILEILNFYDPNKEYSNLIFKNEIKKINKKVSVKEIIYLLEDLKLRDKKRYNEKIKFFEKYLEKFPLKIIDEKTFDEKYKISKSLNKEFKIEFEKIKKERKILENINSIDIANLILKL